MVVTKYFLVPECKIGAEPLQCHCRFLQLFLPQIGYICKHKCKAMKQNIEQMLHSRGITPTPIRILVYEIVSKYKVAFSINELEELLQTVDRSSIFRALSTFEDYGLLHAIDDGDGHRKYCFRTDCCAGVASSRPQCRHIHFTCRMCGKTYCLEPQDKAFPPLPDGFLGEETNYIVKGICKNCR